ncbi:hypothetical protein FOFC_13576 [Fusarium oxysporum]|nr:hypothetical protein FocnCong_v012365 [Fusarium oxysporum f. sp. conglutinans]KAI8406108.1 hypothetical protein FOFC_13576 [Fusarium oxysporum]
MLSQGTVPLACRQGGLCPEHTGPVRLDGAVWSGLDPQTRPDQTIPITGLHYTEAFARFTDENSFQWDDIKLPGDFAVWAASEEAEFLHGRFVWAKWDVNELKTGPLRKKIESGPSLFRVGVSGY